MCATALLGELANPSSLSLPTATFMGRGPEREHWYMTTSLGLDEWTMRPCDFCWYWCDVQNLSVWHLLNICCSAHKTFPVGQSMGAGLSRSPLPQALPLNLCHFVQMQLERIKMSARHNCLHWDEKLLEETMLTSMAKKRKRKSLVLFSW